MITTKQVKSVFFAVTLCWSLVVGAQIPAPPLTAHVVDQTATLTTEQKAALEQTLQAFEARKGSQLAVIMVATTAPEAIEHNFPILNHAHIPMAELQKQTVQTAEQKNALPSISNLKVVQYPPAEIQDPRIAIYYISIIKKIERIESVNFPRSDGKRFFQKLKVWIPVRQDGSIAELGGGLRIEKSSGKENIDRAALQTVRDAAPFGDFPSPPHLKGGDEIWEFLYSFNYIN